MKKTKWAAVITIIALLLGARPSSFDAPKVLAKSTQQQIKDKEEEHQKLEEELKDQQGSINGMKGEKSSLQKELEDLNSQLQEVSDHLEEPDCGKNRGDPADPAGTGGSH